MHSRCAWACLQACSHTYIYIYIYTYIHTYIHTYTYLVSQSSSLYVCRDSWNQGLLAMPGTASFQVGERVVHLSNVHLDMFQLVLMGVLQE